jgi:outer membrane murein-binding lipoprotein Lpp
MRLVGIIAVFVLTVAGIVQAAFLVRLSTRVDTLAEQVRAEGAAGALDADSARRNRPLAAAGESAPVRLPVPRLDPKAPAPAAAEGEALPAAGVLREALSTTEGKQHLKGALEAIREQDRQKRMIEDIEDDVDRDKRNQERLARTLGLSSGEQGSINSLYAQLDSGRKRILEEMKSGVKTADQADDEIDALEDKTETAVNSLLGETRLKQLRDARRAERLQRRLERANQRGQQPATTRPPG